jgi:ribose-phosphate pyrophosphokinase
MNRNFCLFSGTANAALATAVAAELGVRLGLCAATRFPDGETSVQISEPVRGREVFLVQPTSPPVNDHLVELLAFADACRRSAAARFTAVVPYFGYARDDKRHGRREPITASLVARLMQVAGVDHIVTLDLHSEQIEGFFHVPVDSLTAVPTLCQTLRGRLPDGVVVVSPDAGRVAMATEYGHRLDCPVAILHKRRTSGTETVVTQVVGDVRDRPCLIVDDMISTGGTIARAVEALLAAGARREIVIAASHGLFVGDARAKLDHEAIQGVFVTDSVAADRPWPRLRVVPIAPLMAEAIGRLHAGGSLGDLFRDAPASSGPTT